MKTTTVITSNVENIVAEPFGYEIDENYVFANDSETIEILAKEFNVNPKLVKAIANAFEFMSESIIEELHKDLSDIWKKLGKTS